MLVEHLGNGAFHGKIVNEKRVRHDKIYKNAWKYRKITLAGRVIPRKQDMGENCRRQLWATTCGLQVARHSCDQKITIYTAEPCNCAPVELCAWLRICNVRQPTWCWIPCFSSMLIDVQQRSETKLERCERIESRRK